MVREGIVDILQWDILNPGLTRWLEISPSIEAWGRICSPHHYGTFLGNYHLAHLGLSVPNFGFVEWDHATTPGVDTSGYSITEGLVTVPTTPGFGLQLGEYTYGRAVKEGGFSVTA